MNSININWRAAAVVSLVLFVVLFGLLPSVSAQTPAPTLTPEPTPVVDPVDEVPDTGPIADNLFGGLGEFIESNNTRIVIGFLFFIVVAGSRFVLPDTVLDTERIMALLVAAFGIIYMIAQIFGFQEVLGRAIDIGALLGNTATTLLAMLGVAGLSYAALGSGLKIPIIARPQGAKWFNMGEEPQLIEANFATLEIESDGIAEQIARGVADGLRQSAYKG